MILIAAPICEGKIYSINNWLEWIARQQYTDFDYCLCTESTSEEFINKLSQIEIINSGNIKKPIILINEEIIKIDNPIQKICNARETIRLYALENGYSHILFLDSDVVPIYMDTIQKLLDTNLDCVSGLYCYKNSYVPVAVSRKRGTNPTITDMEEANKKNQLIDCLVIGLGCALISRRVFFLKFLLILPILEMKLVKTMVIVGQWKTLKFRDI